MPNPQTSQHNPPQQQSNGGRFVPTNLATCYDGERVYVKDVPTGRCFTNRDCRVEIDEKSGNIIRR